MKGKLIHHFVEEGINQTVRLMHKARKIKVHDFKYHYKLEQTYTGNSKFFSLEVFKSSLDPLLEMDFNQKVKNQRKMDV